MSNRMQWDFLSVYIAGLMQNRRMAFISPHTGLNPGVSARDWPLPVSCFKYLFFPNVLISWIFSFCTPLVILPSQDIGRFFSNQEFSVFVPNDGSKSLYIFTLNIPLVSMCFLIHISSHHLVNPDVLNYNRGPANSAKCVSSTLFDTRSPLVFLKINYLFIVK